MTHIIRTDFSHPDFIALVKQLDAELAIRDGKDHAFYHQYNSIDDIKFALVAYQNELPIGCGAIKQFDAQSMEIKRVYLLPEFRGKGLAQKLLTQLEHWTAELGYAKCILETGKKQPEAIRLYEKSGYKKIANYGPYIGVDNSVCFEKLV